MPKGSYGFVFPESAAAARGRARTVRAGVRRTQAGGPGPV